MGWWDDISWEISKVMEPLGNSVASGLYSALDSTDSVVTKGIADSGSKCN